MELHNKKIKKKPTKIEEMTKEQIRQAILKKRECNTKAQNIVESLLENCITEAHFLECLPDINQSHFEDVIEERCITHLCGYPLCNKTLLEKDIPKQKYRISVKTNKVYDITARKSFCSNTCYKAAMYVKKQMLTSPLWFREYEDVPTFHLLPLDTTGILGQEIDLALIEKINIKTEKKAFTSVNEFACLSLHDVTENEAGNDDKTVDQKNINSIKYSLTNKTDEQVAVTENEMVNVVETNLNETSTNDVKEQKENNASKVTQKPPNILEQLDKNTANMKERHKKLAPNPLNIVGEIVEKPAKNLDPILAEMPEKINKENNKTVKKQQKKQPPVSVIAIEVEKCLAEWFTLDTMLLLFGEGKVKEMVIDKGECIKEYLNNYSQSIFYNSNSYDQYQELCRKLNMLELEDKRYDAQALQREMKPLPHFSALQEESKKMQLKVRAFFAGETEIPVTNVGDMNDASTTETSNLTQLPLVDKNAQYALRRRIVYQHLNKVLPDLLQSLGLRTVPISSDVRLLINTFKLKANNIMFKPIQWTLIALVVINLLSLRDRRLRFLLDQPTAYRHMQLLLLSYKQDGGYIDRLISWLTDIDRLLDTNDTQLTIE